MCLFLEALPAGAPGSCMQPEVKVGSTGTRIKTSELALCRSAAPLPHPPFLRSSAHASLAHILPLIKIFTPRWRHVSRDARELISAGATRRQATVAEEHCKHLKCCRLLFAALTPAILAVSLSFNA